MKVLISGSSGFVGTALVARLRDIGHTVVRLVRTRSSKDKDSVFWDPDAGVIDSSSLIGIEAVIHLAGENVSAHRWSAAQRKKILESRTRGTELIGRTISALQPQPKVLLSASAIGYYGNHGSDEMTEQHPAGRGFLADVCVEWERTAKESVADSIRLVFLRIGVVLGKDGGALGKMLLPFRLGIGGPIGDGKNFLSWIALPDLVEAIIFCLDHDQMSGPVNLCAPKAVTSRDFAKALGRALHRPAVLPVPELMLKLVFGEMAEQTILSSMRVVPARLLDAGFAFKYVDVETALKAVI
ncbi:MAG: TIGR01777 family oxidoreductase [Bdellovibrionota bacterium]